MCLSVTAIVSHPTSDHLGNDSPQIGPEYMQLDIHHAVLPNVSLRVYHASPAQSVCGWHWISITRRSVATSATLQVRQPPRMVFAPGEGGLHISLPRNLGEVAIRGWPKAVPGNGVLPADPLNDMHDRDL